MGLTGNPYLPASDLQDTGVGGQLKFSVIAGGASAADLALTGIDVDDTVVQVKEYTKSGGNVTDVLDRTGQVTAIKAGAIQLASVSTGSKLEICWLDRHPSEF